MTAGAFEYQVGEKGDGRGINYPQAFHPGRLLAALAVR